MQAYDWRLEPILWCAEGFWIDREDEELLLGSTAEHLSGMFYIQEASSMLFVSALFADGGKAAPDTGHGHCCGTRLQNHPDCGADEQSRQHRCQRVLLQTGQGTACQPKPLWGENVALTNFDGRVFGAVLPESFDAILLDAPCSGEGVVRKDPDAMNNWSPESVAEITDTKCELINSTLHALVPGGVMVYFRHTLNAQENQQIV